MDFLKTHKTTILYTTILIIYAIVVFVTGFYHEPWADEAQAWLIARDNSFFDLIFIEPRYEGHPFIWFFILKLFMMTNIAPSTIMYDWIFLISCAFSCVGIYLFLFKSNFPIPAKILIPFTFFLAYQYSVIARNHSLVFPMLAIIACVYKDRLKKPILYLSLLLIAANISAYSFVIAGVMFAFFIYETFKNKIKLYAPIVITGILFLISYLLISKTADNSTTAGFEISRFGVDRLLYMITNAFFNFNISLFLIETTIVLAFYVFCYKKYCTNLYEKLLFVAINLPIPILLSMFSYRVDWHFGYIILTLIFSCWLLIDENKTPNKLPKVSNFIFALIFTLLVSTQIIWTLKCSIYDINNKYTSAKEIANYIKENHLYEYPINAVGFKTVELQPYFDKNIYANYVHNSNYSWKQEYYNQYVYKMAEKTPIYIVEKSTTKQFNPLIDYLDKNYKQKVFKADMCSKGKLFENNNFYLYEKLD